MQSHLDELDKLIVRYWSVAVRAGTNGLPGDVYDLFVRRGIEVKKAGDGSKESACAVISGRMLQLRARRQLP